VAVHSREESAARSSPLTICAAAALSPCMTSSVGRAVPRGRQGESERRLQRPGTSTVMGDIEVIDGVVWLAGEVERKSTQVAVPPTVRAVDRLVNVGPARLRDR
jgi:hypothetical protein